MDTGNQTHPGDPGDPGKPPTQRNVEAKKAVGWLGHVVVAQLIAYCVRHWLP